LRIYERVGLHRAPSSKEGRGLSRFMSGGYAKLGAVG
jgi:hypothetical protein